MPIWLRNFTFNKIKEHFEREAKTLQKSKKATNTKSNQIARPNIKPAYTTKASNK